MSHYQQDILAILPTCNPRHVEAYMRAENPTLDHLDRAQFALAAGTANVCALMDPDTAEKLARSYGL